MQKEITNGDDAPILRICPQYRIVLIIVKKSKTKTKFLKLYSHNTDTAV